VECAPRGERGSIAVELALGVPLSVLLVFLLIAAFHLARASVDVTAAAAAASRAASLARTADAAARAARDSADANLSRRCARLRVDVDVTRFRRGGAVTVTLACTVTARGLTGAGVPGAVTTRASSTSPLDVYRAVTP